jgi:large subunit ribosomal protein L6
MRGTTRAHLANMVTGVTKGYERKLELVGVGYRAAMQGKNLNLTLGFSHPVRVPGAGRHHDRDAEPDRDPDQGHRQAAGRPGGREDPRFRPPEPYKGKGVRYAARRSS